MTTSYMSYILIMITHRGHECERACASACVIMHSLIYGRFLFKFAVNILQITTSSMGYVLFMFTHRAHALVVKQSLIFGRILFKFAGHILHMTTSYMGYILIMFTTRVRLSLNGFSPNLVRTYNRSPQVSLFNWCVYVCMS
jgi:hypothetical protein